MKTTGIGIQNHCAPCACACRHCLLQSCKKADHVDYYRGLALARRFAAWTKDTGFSPAPFYYVTDCAEYPQLTETIRFNFEVGFTGATYLQLNGIAIRSRAETDAFLTRLHDAGVKYVDTTFYGSRAYHDAFAARTGDFDYMLLLAGRAALCGVTCSPTVAITKENLDMLPALFDTLEAVPGVGKIQSFLPNHRGRGNRLEEIRITRADYERLPENIKRTFNTARYKTEAEWLYAGPLPEYTKRFLEITLRDDNIDLFEKMSCDEIVKYVEKLDDDYYAAIPGSNELAAMYGDKTNERLYQMRDLFWMWQKRYIKENGLNVYDVTDERNCATVRS